MRSEVRCNIQVYDACAAAARVVDLDERILDGC